MDSVYSCRHTDWPLSGNLPLYRMLKCLCSLHGRHSAHAHLWMAAAKKLTHSLSDVGQAKRYFARLMDFLDFSGVAVVKNLHANAGDAIDLSLIPGWRRSPGGGNGNPLQYSCPENPMDRGAWWARQSMGSQRVRHDRPRNGLFTFLSPPLLCPI